MFIGAQCTNLPNKKLEHFQSPKVKRTYSNRNCTFSAISKYIYIYIYKIFFYGETGIGLPEYVNLEKIDILTAIY